MAKEVIQIAIIGDALVGKSSIIRRFYGDEFSDVHIPALYEKDISDFKITEKVHKIKLIDTNRSTKLDNLALDLIILCYSIENRMSFRSITTKWMDEIKKLSNWPVPFVLAATKIDLWQEFPTNFFITSADGENLSSEIGAIKYFELSAKENVNIQQLIEHSVKILYPNEQKPDEKKIKFQEPESSNGHPQRSEPMTMKKESSCICC